jgi:lipopolysaccharide assembly outer membrane protein LptD (OstA)
MLNSPRSKRNLEDISMGVSVSTSRHLCAIAFIAAFLAMSAGTAVGQQLVDGFSISGARQQLISPVETKFSGGVTMQRGDITVVADDVTLFTDRDLIVATGNVVFNQGENKISSASATFGVKSQLGTFLSAYVVFAVQGITPLYFYGETVEQTDSKTYRVTNGGFTSSTQPTPSWQGKSAAIVFSVK